MNRALAAFLSLLIPGWGHLLLNDFKTAISCQIFLICTVILVCLTRAIVQPSGLSILVLTILSTHLASCIWCLLSKSPQTKQINKFLFFIFPTVFLPLAIGLFYFRQSLLGFGIFYISSHSMLPTVQPGDIVLTNTWAYVEQKPLIEDIILFTKSHTNQSVQIKRIKDSRFNSKQQITEIFVKGDNQDSSTDSRHYGWISEENIIGRATYLIANYTANENKLRFDNTDL